MWCSCPECHNNRTFHHLDETFVALVPCLELENVATVLGDCVTQQLRSVTRKVESLSPDNVIRDADVLLAVDAVGDDVEEHAIR
jgi:hypothetical protein